MRIIILFFFTEKERGEEVMEFEERQGRVTEWDVFASRTGVNEFTAHWKRAPPANRLHGAGTARGEASDVACWIGLSAFWLTATEPHNLPHPTPPVSLSWTGLLPCSSTDFWIRLPASEDTLRMWTKESWGGVNTQLHGNKMQGSVWLVCIWSRPFFLEPPFSLFCRISICNWRQEMSH